MRYFTVTVQPMRVQIDEQTKEFAMYDSSATVDGEIWCYKIKKGPNIAKNNRTWRSRAYQNIHYHANNSGEIVRFTPVHHATRSSRKINEKQLSMW